VEFRFPVCKLSELDLAPWLAAGNPVARVIEAHRLAQETGGKPSERRKGKFGLVRNLLTSEMPDRDIREVLRLIHWLLALPPAEEVSFRQDLQRLDEETHMPNLSTYDRLVWEEGRVEGYRVGLHSMLLDLVTHRFGPPGVLLRDKIQAVQDEVELQRLARSILTTASIEEFSLRLNTRPPSPPGN
jgi:hypothetical protein